MSLEQAQLAETKFISTWQDFQARYDSQEITLEQRTAESKANQARFKQELADAEYTPESLCDELEASRIAEAEAAKLAEEAEAKNG